METLFLVFNAQAAFEKAVEHFKTASDYFPSENVEMSFIFLCDDQDDMDVLESFLDEELNKAQIEGYHFECE